MLVTKESNKFIETCDIWHVDAKMGNQQASAIAKEYVNNYQRDVKKWIIMIE